MSETTRYSVNEGEVVAQDFEGEVVIINLAKGLYYSTDAVGAQVWALTTSGYSTDEIARALEATYSIDGELAGSDVDHITADFVTHGLVVPGADAPAESAQIAAREAGYSTPALGVHDDIGHLLALDPPVPALQTNLTKPAPEDS